MNDIAIFGAGGFGREVACLINLINKETPTWNLIGFFDDNPELKGKHNEYGEILGGVDVLNEWHTPLSLLIAIGSGTIVKNVKQRGRFFLFEKAAEPSAKGGSIKYHTYIPCIIDIMPGHTTVGMRMSY